MDSQNGRRRLKDGIVSDDSDISSDTSGSGPDISAVEEEESQVEQIDAHGAEDEDDEQDGKEEGGTVTEEDVKLLERTLQWAGEENERLARELQDLENRRKRIWLQKEEAFDMLLQKEGIGSM